MSDQQPPPDESVQPYPTAPADPPPPPPPPPAQPPEDGDGDGDGDLDAPGEERPSFRLRVALLAAAITLFGAVVGNLQVRAGDDRDIADREAQRDAIIGVGERVRSATDFQFHVAVQELAEEYERRADIARGRARYVGALEEDSTLAVQYEAEATKWDEVRDRIAPFSPLLAEEDSDPIEAQNRYAADLDTPYVTRTLTQEAHLETYSAWRRKADTYVALVTVLAVALFLQGIALTVAYRLRWWLVGPAIALFAITLAWTGWTAFERVPSTPKAAIDAVAEGQRQLVLGRPVAAAKAFSEAIEARDDYAAAWAGRSDAHLTLATRAVTGTAYTTSEVTDRRQLQLSIDDGEKAVAHGIDDANVIGGLGNSYLLARRYQPALKYTEQAIELNSRQPFLWMNLAAIRLALDDIKGASEALDRGLEIVGGERFKFVANELYSAVRTDLERVAGLNEDKIRAAQDLEKQVAIAELEWWTEAEVERLSDDEAYPITDPFVYYEGGQVIAETETAAPFGTPLLYVWWHRTSAGGPWLQDPSDVVRDVAGELEDGTEGIELIPFADPGACAGPRTWRLDVWAADVLVSSTQLLDADGEERFVAGPLGDTEVVDVPDLGITACLPEGWTRTDEEDFITLADETATNTLTLGSQPIGAVTEEEAGELEQLALDSIVAELESLGPMIPDDPNGPFFSNFGVATGLVNDYTLETSGTEITVLVGVSAGEDGVLRTLTVVGLPTEGDLLRDLRDAVRFVPGPALPTPPQAGDFTIDEEVPLEEEVPFSDEPLPEDTVPAEGNLPEEELPPPPPEDPGVSGD